MITKTEFRQESPRLVVKLAEREDLNNYV